MNIPKIDNMQTWSTIAESKRIQIIIGTMVLRLLVHEQDVGISAQVKDHASGIVLAQLGFRMEIVFFIFLKRIF